MHPVLLRIGPFTIYTYGFMIAAGLSVALYLMLRAAKKEGIRQDVLFNLFFYIVLAGFLGGRVFYIITEWQYFLAHPLRVFFANEGFVFYGGFIFAFLAAFLYARIKKIHPWKLADIIAAPAALAHAIGRLGCFFYGCCYGRPTQRWFGIKFPAQSPAGALGVAVIPTQLISFAALLAIFIVLIFLKKRRKFYGQVFFSYTLIYAGARFLIEFLRADPRGRIWIFSASQFIAILMAAVSLIMLSSLRGGQKADEAIPKK